MKFYVIYRVYTDIWEHLEVFDDKLFTTKEKAIEYLVNNCGNYKNEYNGGILEYIINSERYIIDFLEVEN